MTIRITVVRGAGSEVGEDLVVSLAGNENVLLNKGRNALDGFAEKKDVSMTVVYREGLNCGQLVQVEDVLEGVTWRGKLVAISHRYTRGGVSTDLKVERFV